MDGGYARSCYALMVGAAFIMSVRSVSVEPVSCYSCANTTDKPECLARNETCRGDCYFYQVPNIHDSDGYLGGHAPYLYMGCAANCSVLGVAAVHAGPFTNLLCCPRDYCNYYESFIVSCYGPSGMTVPIIIGVVLAAVCLIALVAVPRLIARCRPKTAQPPAQEGRTDPGPPSYDEVQMHYPPSYEQYMKGLSAEVSVPT